MLDEEYPFERVGIGGRIVERMISELVHQKALEIAARRRLQQEEREEQERQSVAASQSPVR